jgi:hypothetical protein
MQSRKEYAVGLGLAKPGRGRLSKDAWAAIHKAEQEGMQFSDKSQPVVKEPINVVPKMVTKPSVKVRDIGTQLIGYTQEGWAVGFTNCRRCHQHANYCNCKQGILTPSIVVTLDKDSAAVLTSEYINK